MPDANRLYFVNLTKNNNPMSVVITSKQLARLASQSSLANKRRLFRKLGHGASREEVKGDMPRLSLN